MTTIYNSSATIEEFCRRAEDAAAKVTSEYEIIVVDDGSPDDALDKVVRLASQNPRIKVVELSRNFGHHKALMTGMDNATGDLCLLIDSDLEEPPEMLGEFWAELHRAGSDVVYGYQAIRQGSRRFSAIVAWWLFKTLIPQRIPQNHITMRLMRRRYVDSLLLHREQQTVIGGLWVITGYKQTGIPVAKTNKATTDYNFRRRWHALVDSITSFSEVPLIGIFYLGIVISLLATVVGAVLLVLKMTRGRAVEGWISVMLSVWFLGGLAILSIGITGIYVSKIFIETKRRPYTIIRAVHGMGANSPDKRA